jgi:hypothetical protein
MNCKIFARAHSNLFSEITFEKELAGKMSGIEV